VFQLGTSSVVIGAGAGKGTKHHYIPVFYLKQWAGTDGRICEFSRPHREVKPRRVHPDGTAYVRGLYTVPGIAPHLAEYIERRFLLKSDSAASDALRFMLSGDKVEWPHTPRLMVAIHHLSYASQSRVCDSTRRSRCCLFFSDLS
jgi:hypothetical protein